MKNQLNATILLLAATVMLLACLFGHYFIKALEIRADNYKACLNSNKTHCEQ